MSWLIDFLKRYPMPKEAVQELEKAFYRQSVEIPAVPSSFFNSSLGPVDLERNENDATSLNLSSLPVELSDEDDATSLDHGATKVLRQEGESSKFRGLEEQDPFWERYEDLGLIGMGGMGEVRRMRDRVLNRVVAVKVIRPEFEDNDEAMFRFVEEAQATSQLFHPGIIPIYELGKMSDGRLFFAMKEVRGVTLAKVIRDVHSASRNSTKWMESETGWSLRRMIEVLHKACEAMAFAHVRGVLHRDLKPSNIMLGSFGEVQVVDWGVVKVLGRPERSAKEVTPQIMTNRFLEGSLQTEHGLLVGTASYMSPEQARGEVTELTMATDVYSLGAILYKILSGRPPHTGSDTSSLLLAIQSEPWFPTFDVDSFEPLPSKQVQSSGTTEPVWHSRPIPEELVEVCRKALRQDPLERYPSASEMASAIGAWLDGTKNRERGQEFVQEARSLIPEIQQIKKHSKELYKESRSWLEEHLFTAAEEQRNSVWELEDEAKRLEHVANAKEAKFFQLLNSALTYSEELNEAHYFLADHYWSLHKESEQNREVLKAERYALHLRHHDRENRYLEYLIGDGSLTLHTNPSGATVSVFPYVEVNRRLVKGELFNQWKTPIEGVRLPMGSYLLEIEAEGRAVVRYPVSIQRLEHWGAQPPGESRPSPVCLPEENSIADDDCYVPEGWFGTGGDPSVSVPMPLQHIWLKPFVIKKFPVTNRDFLLFLNALVSSNLKGKALQYVPRERPSNHGELGEIIYHLSAEGFFELGPDADGDVWEEEWPVMMITWNAACAYAEWYSEQTGLPWRLPTELEWEKAGRGVDARFYPWGNFFVPGCCCVRSSCTNAKLLPTSSKAFPGDESPYGVRGMAGNMRDWCADLFSEKFPILPTEQDSPQAVNTNAYRVLRGGNWSSPDREARLAARHQTPPQNRDASIGFRLCRSFEPN